MSYQPATWASVCGGVMQNLAESDEGTILMVGFGLGPQWLQVDLAAVASTKTTVYGDTTISSDAKIRFGLSSQW